MPREGIKTIEHVRERCYVDDFTGCWHWRGSMKVSSKGRRTPQLHIFDSVARRSKTVSGPLAVLDLAGRRTAQTQRGWRTCLCDDCLNPAHVMGGTHKQWGAWLRERGLWQNSPARLAAGRMVARARSAISPQQIELARACRTGREAAALLGITESHASKIRNRRIWSDQAVRGASVFSLGAR